MDNHTLQQVIDLAVKTAVLKVKRETILECRPVGSYFITETEDDPNVLFGGTWEPIQDVFLWCAGPKHAAGTSGGEETHMLTNDEMPEHTHSISSTNITGSFYVWWSTVNAPSGCFWGDIVTHNPSRNGVIDNDTVYYDRVNFNDTHSHSIGNTGGNQPHNNMPPYRSVYAWQRVK